MVTWLSGCWEWSRRRCFSPITQTGRVCTQRAVNVWWIMQANDCSHFSCHQLCSLSVSAAACRHVTVTRCHCRHAARRNHDNDVSLLWQACKIHLMNDNRKIHVEQRHDQRLSLSSALSLSLCNFGILWLKPRRIELIFGIFNRVELNGCLDPPTESHPAQLNWSVKLHKHEEYPVNFTDTTPYRQYNLPEWGFAVAYDWLSAFLNRLRDHWLAGPTTLLRHVWPLQHLLRSSIRVLLQCNFIHNIGNMPQTPALKPLVSSLGVHGVYLFVSSSASV